LHRDDLQGNDPSKDDSFMRKLENAIQESDLEKLKALIAKDPGVVNRECDWLSRQYNNHPLAYAANFGKVEVMKVLIQSGADVNVNTPYGNPMSRAMGRGDIAAMDLLYEHGAAFDMDGALMLACEAQAPDTIRWLLGRGANPNYYHEGWGCSVLMANMQTYARSFRLPECVSLFIDAGAEYEDGPIMDILRGRPDLLAARLAEDPALAKRHYDFDYGDFLTLRGSTLLHIAVEYYVRPCIDVLLEHGADINAKALIGKNGVGGQSPIFHIIGRSTWGGYGIFEYLLGKSPDLTIKAHIQEDPPDGKIMDCMHKGQDHYFREVREFTPLGYAMRYKHEPEWRSAAQEAEKLWAMNAPEA